MKKVTAIIGIILTFMVGALQAQTMASELVKKTIDKINKHKNVEFVFDYDMSNETIAVTESASGTAYLQGDAYKLEVEGQQIISDGKTMWTYLPDSEEVMISNPSNDENIITPIKLLTTYDKDYRSYSLPLPLIPPDLPTNSNAVSAIPSLRIIPSCLLNPDL